MVNFVLFCIISPIIKKRLRKYQAITPSWGKDVSCKVLKLVNLTINKRVIHLTNCNLQLVLPNPGATDAGDYRCSMSFLGTHHGLQTDTADAEMKAYDLKAMLEDVRKVEGDLNACRERCFCK